MTSVPGENEMLEVESPADLLFDIVAAIFKAPCTQDVIWDEDLVLSLEQILGSEFMDAVLPANQSQYEEGTVSVSSDKQQAEENFEEDDNYTQETDSVANSAVNTASVTQEEDEDSDGPDFYDYDTVCISEKEFWDLQESTLRVSEEEDFENANVPLVSESMPPPAPHEISTEVQVGGDLNNPAVTIENDFSEESNDGLAEVGSTMSVKFSEQADSVEKESEDIVEATEPEETSYSHFNLRIVHQPGHTGFEASKELKVHKGMLIAGQYEVCDVIGEAAFSTAIKCVDIERRRL